MFMLEFKYLACSTYIEEPDIIDEKYLGQIFTNKTFDEFQTQCHHKQRT